MTSTRAMIGWLAFVAIYVAVIVGMILALAGATY